jgi:hypothetical protein
LSSKFLGLAIEETIINDEELIGIIIYVFIKGCAAIYIVLVIIVKVNKYIFQSDDGVRLLFIASTS